MPPARLTSESKTYTGGTGDDDDHRPSFYRRKRPNIVHACLMCQKKKRRCDDTLPCKACVERNIPCQWVERKKKVSRSWPPSPPSPPPPPPPPSEPPVDLSTVQPSSTEPIDAQVGRTRCLPRNGIPCEFCLAEEEEARRDQHTLTAYSAPTQDGPTPVLSLPYTFPLTSVPTITPASEAPVEWLANAPAYGAHMATQLGPFVAPFSESNLFAGVPMGQPTHLMPWSTVPTYYPLDDGQRAVDPSILHQLQELAGSPDDYFHPGPFDANELRQPISENPSLDAVSHANLHSVPDASHSVHTSYHDGSVSAYPAQLPGNAALATTALPGPSTTLQADPTQQQTSNAAQQVAFDELFNNWLYVEYPDPDSNDIADH
ncbi:hypothetical protein LXA43DRAFT_1099321 [Ganoderma leucocontextum]|nr:hypothetical protein LXA43DRAFT_1099321 [Ganoderma leucocontextum]